MSMPAEERALGATGGMTAVIPPEPPDVSARGLIVASRLLAGATTFFFLAFLFAYFYLRSLDVDHMWRPGHVKPDRGLGTAFVVCLILSAGAVIVAARNVRAKDPAWKGPAAGGVALGLAAVALQCIEFTQQHFGPTDGAFASVFCAWSALYLVAVLGALYWIETSVAGALRSGRQSAGAGGDHSDIRDPDALIAPGFDAATFYWVFLVALGVITYVVLYLL